MEEAFPKQHPWHFEPIHGHEPDYDKWDAYLYLFGAFGMGLIVGLLVTGN
jgi:hypothetical protein